EDGFEAVAISTFDELESLVHQPKTNFDLVLLDRLLDGKDASQLIPKIKDKVTGAKILVLSAINTPIEKAQVLDLGADDYLAKPYEYEELLARMKAVLRRSSTVLRLGNLL